MQLFAPLFLTFATAKAAYVLQRDYMAGGNFVDQFTFFTDPDPTSGFVQYLSEADARANNLIQSSGNQISLYADSTETTTVGRKSIRIQSKESYSSGLIVLDLEHMPGGICGTWPAFWTLGPNWPNQGEIDIIEGINDQRSNDMTLHTGAGCTISKSSNFQGSIVTDDCNTYAADQPENAGCSVQAASSNTYGKGFNDIGGGVYATEWTESSISIYFFPRSSIPADIETDSPNPQNWGVPLATFQGDCDIATKFTNQQILFDITFCGIWAGGAWGGSSCAAQNNGQTCEAFVGSNPAAFKEAYWTINGLKVFQANSDQPSTSSIQMDPTLTSSRPTTIVPPATFSPQSTLTSPSGPSTSTPTTASSSTHTHMTVRTRTRSNGASILPPTSGSPIPTLTTASGSAPTQSTMPTRSPNIHSSILSPPPVTPIPTLTTASSPARTQSTMPTTSPDSHSSILSSPSGSPLSTLTTASSSAHTQLTMHTRTPNVHSSPVAYTRRISAIPATSQIAIQAVPTQRQHQPVLVQRHGSAATRKGLLAKSYHSSSTTSSAVAKSSNTSQRWGAKEGRRTRRWIA